MWKIRIKQNNGRIFEITVHSDNELADSIHLIKTAKWEIVDIKKVEVE